jgi:hypothetical protein
MMLDLPIGGSAAGIAGADAVTVSPGNCAGTAMGFSTGARDGLAIFLSTAVSRSGKGIRVSATSMICCNAVASAALVRVAAGNKGALAWVSCCGGCSTTAAGIGPLGRAAAPAFALVPAGAGSCVCHCVAPYTAVAINMQAALGSIQCRFDGRGPLAGCGAAAESDGDLKGFTCAAAVTGAASVMGAAGVARRAVRTPTKAEL